MSDYLIFDGVDSRNYNGIYVFRRDVDSIPEHVHDKVSVAGRNGDLTISQKKFKNIRMEYGIVVVSSQYNQTLSNFVNAILVKNGYKRLSDSIHSDEYYRACIDESMAVTTSRNRELGKFYLAFDRDPRRFLVSGEDEVAVASGGTITNPTSFPSKPVIAVTGYGVLTINSQSITISNTFPSITIDCELQDCYYGLQNANRQVVIEGNEFPELKSGVNNITYDNTITGVTVVPRWWRI